MARHEQHSKLSTRWKLADGTDILIRPIRPEDAAIETAFIARLSEQSRYFRFMGALRELTPEMLERFTRIDYEREMALIALAQEGGKDREIAVARYITNPDGMTCEFAVVVADEWVRKGIGSQLLRRLMEDARARGLRTMAGEVLSENRPMLEMAGNLGFGITSSKDDPGVMMLSKNL